MSISRRDFVRSAAGFAAFSLGGGALPASAAAARRGSARRPVFVSSENGDVACNHAMAALRQDTDLLDAIVGGINIVEDDPDDHSVGYGGLPNEDGVVQLDACVMDGRTHKAGAVAALERIRNPSSVAVQVMRRTDHVLIVGEGAFRFARAHGFEEQELLTDAAREIWLRWKETHSGNDDWIRPEADEEARRYREEGPDFTYGTISCIGVTDAGDVAGCTSTSGLSYKIPGRVGDSPIIGAGLYVDNEVGGCGSTGRGEANLQNCACFTVVELMRQGMEPEEASLETLRRIARKAEPRLRNADGEPAFDLKFYAVRNDGVFGGAGMRRSARMAVNDGDGARKVDLPVLYA